MKNHKKLYPIVKFFKNFTTGLYRKIFIIVFFCIFLLIFTTWRQSLQVVSHSVISPIPADKKTESITILAGDTRVNFSVPPNTIFYDALAQEKNAGKITFSGKNYPGLGFFVTDIGTLRSGNGKNLIYYVNGKQASVGVSSYTLKNGDIIEWKLE